MKKALKAIIRHFGYDLQALPKDRFAVFDEAQHRDYWPLKSFATRAARYSGSLQCTQAVRSIYLTGVLQEQAPAEHSRIEIGDAKTLEVGIWRRDGPAANAAFTRRVDKKGEWWSWASLERIGPKRSKWRIVLLGESVARGYLYDPQFNLAMALSTMLGSELGTENVDVVDLAKSNLTLQELKTHIGQSLALSPDLLVIFAGNNWRPQLAASDIPYVEGILHRDGVPGMKAFLDEKRRHAVRNLIVQMSTILSQRDVKIIWVVPEFNLDDWVDPPSNAPQLPEGRNQRWRVLDERTTQALRDGNSDLAREFAGEMADLDGNTSSVPLRVLAECCRSTGDLEGARQYLELCRDAEGWDPSFSLSPRVSSIVQSALREAASLPGSFVVDLPDRLRRHLDGQLPGRRVFLDYCHLTGEGINVTAAAIASHAVAILGGKAVPEQAMLRKASHPSEQAEGKACFLAAVHNAHFYQRPEIVRYWCSRAVRLWPKSAELMARYIEYETHNLPIMASKPGLELLELDELDTVRYLASGRVRRLDLTLGDAIAATLDGTGFQIGARIDQLRLEQHSAADDPRELTDFYFSSAIPSVSERGWTSRGFPNNRGSHSDYTAALWDTSQFLFFARKGENIVLKLTYRVPMAASDNMVAVEVNGQRVAEMSSQPTWCTHDIVVDSDWIVSGVNEILVLWPTEEPASDVVLGRIADELAAQQLPRFYRVFGEIHTFYVFCMSESTISSSQVLVGSETPG